jgi:hypothetical protein
MEDLAPDYSNLQTDTFHSNIRHSLNIGLYPTISFYRPSEHLSSNSSLLSYLTGIGPLQ